MNFSIAPQEIWHFYLFGIKFAFTHASFALCVPIVCLILLQKKHLKLLYLFCCDLCNTSLQGNTTFLPLLMANFLFIVIVNVIACFKMFPLAASPVFPFLLSGIVFFSSCIVGCKNKKWRFFTDFVPPSVPLLMKPVVFCIEFLSFLIRPFSLAIRLLFNIAIGHFVVHILYSVTDSFGIYAIATLPVMVMLNCLEILRSCIQAYLFTVFSTIIIGNCLNSH